MTKDIIARMVLRLRVVPAINLSGNLLGAAVAFVWFSSMAPFSSPEGVSSAFWHRLTFFIALIVIVIAGVIPINFAWIFRPLVRELRKLASAARKKDPEFEEASLLHSVAGKILDFPVKLALTTFACWVVCAIAFDLAPHLIPKSYPWDIQQSHRMVAWTIFVGGPIMVISTYFVIEWWVRSTLHNIFPHNVLISIPPSFRINVLPKMLVVTLMIGIVPVMLVGHVTLQTIREVQAGRQALDILLTHMPEAIRFLCIWAAVVAVGLSIFMSKSISEPLRYARSAMEKIGKGDLDAVVPVVSNDDIGRMGEQFNRMLAEHRELDSIRDTFGRYLSREVVEEILKSHGGVELGGELRDITVMVSDLRGFTRLTESRHPRVVLELINGYLEKMTDVIIKYEGTIDEFTGDGILVFFGAPRLISDHARRAVMCALEMQEAMRALNAANTEVGLPELQMGIGINRGELIVGNIGCEKRKKYGAVGSPINMAFRVEGQTVGGEILLTPSVHECLDGEFIVESTREVQLKGIDKPVTVYRVIGMTDRGKGAARGIL